MNCKVMAFIALAVLGGCGQSDKNKATVPSQPMEWVLPDPGFRVGRGYDLDAQDAIRGDCIQNPESMMTESWVDAQGIKAELTETRIKSHEQLMKELSYDVSASARYTFFSGQASYSRYDKFTSTEDGFTWIFNIQAEVGTRTLKTEQITPLSLKPEAQALVTAARSGDAAAKARFYAMCGKKFVRTVRLGGHITDVLEISSKDVETIDKIKTEISASGGGGFWKASGSAHFSSYMQAAQQRSMLIRELSQVGGNHINYDMAPDNVQATLDTFSQSLNQQNAAVISVELVDWGSVLTLDATTVVDQARAIKLQELLRQLWSTQSTMDKINKYLYLYENNSVTLTDSQVEGLRRSYAEADKFVSSVIEAGSQCYQDAGKCSSTLTPVVVQFPALDFRRQDEETIQLPTWTFSYPDLAAVFSPSTEGASTMWTTIDPIIAHLPNGEQVQLRTELFEERCSTISDALSSQGPSVLVSDQGETLNWSERTTSHNPREIMTVLTFGYQGAAGTCLLLQVYTDHPASQQLSLEEDSEAARTVRRIAQSVRKK